MASQAFPLVLALAILAASGCSTPKSIERDMAAAMARNDGGTIRQLVTSRPALARASDELGQTPLHWAAYHNDTTLAEMLLSKGAKVNAFAKRHAWGKDEEAGEATDFDFFEATTPLHQSLIKGNWDIARLLVKRGADVNLPTEGCGDGYSSYTPLELAVEDADVDFILLLIRAGARVRDCGNQFHWPLEQARERTDIMKVLLEQGANIEWSGVDGYKTLHLSVFNNQPAATAFLLEHGAKVDAPDMGGGTSLHLAACYGNVECAKILLAHGANAALKDNDGQTPLMVAEKPADSPSDPSVETRKPVAELLRRHDAGNTK
jgi:ankyrin repeat protein